MSTKELQVKHTCCVRIWRGFGYYNGECGKPSKVEVDGKHYCGIHNPIKRKEKEAIKRAEWQAKWEAENVAHEAKRAKQAEIERRADCYTELLEALQGLLKRDQYPKGTVGWVWQEDARKAIAKALGEQAYYKQNKKAREAA